MRRGMDNEAQGDNPPSKLAKPSLEPNAPAFEDARGSILKQNHLHADKATPDLAG
jgi:hypothetical protein